MRTSIASCPYSNSQVGGTVGGPIVQSKLHYFASYEREREPNTAVISPAALAPQLITMPIEEKKDYYLGRFDAQFGTKDHLVASEATSTSASCPTTA